MQIGGRSRPRGHTKHSEQKYARHDRQCAAARSNGCREQA
jgi:hypothetical protein